MLRRPHVLSPPVADGDGDSDLDSEKPLPVVAVRLAKQSFGGTTNAKMRGGDVAAYIPFDLRSDEITR